MSRNIHQVYIDNPITSNQTTDLMYFGRSPYGIDNDTAMLYSNFATGLITNSSSQISSLTPTWSASGWSMSVDSAGGTVIDIDAGTGFLFSDLFSSNPYFDNEFTTGNPYTLDGSTSGANGLDTGTLLSSTWYQVQIIADSTGVNPSASLLTRAGDPPTFPSGYNRIRIIGWALTNGSAKFLPFGQTNILSNRRTITWLTPITVVNGSSTTGTNAINTDGAIPLDADGARVVRAFFTYTWTPAATANRLTIDVDGIAADQFVTGGIIASVAQLGQFQIQGIFPNDEYQYTQTGGTLTVNVTGYEYEF